MKKNIAVLLLVLGLTAVLPAENALYVSFQPSYFIQFQDITYHQYDGLQYEFRLEFGSLERQENWWLGIGLLSREFEFSPDGDLATFSMIPISFGWGLNLKFTPKTAVKFKIGLFAALCSETYVSHPFTDDISDVVPGIITGISLRILQTSRFFIEAGVEYQYGFMFHQGAYIVNNGPREIRVDAEIRLEGLKFGINFGLNTKEQPKENPPPFPL
jgi:hypothetical protein